MPRTSPKQREAERFAICRRIRHYYDDLTRERGYEAAAATLGFPCATTLYGRLKNPSKLSLAELQSIASAMNISLVTLLCGKEDGYE